jgi:hypothetical protein
MPYEHGDKVYLTQQEAMSKEYLNVAYTTFQGIKEDYDLKPESFPGRSRTLFFLRDVIELIKNSTVSQKAEIRKKIQALQEAE